MHASPRRRGGLLLALVSTVATLLLPALPSGAGAAPAAPSAPGAASLPASGGWAEIEDRAPAATRAPAALAAELEVVAAAHAEVHPHDDAAAAEAPTEAEDHGIVVASEAGLAPFSLLGVTLPAAAEPALVRVATGGAWGPWQTLHFTEDHGPDGATTDPAAGAHSEPIWVGEADAYEVAVPSGAGEPIVHVGRDEEVVAAAAADDLPTAFDYSPGVRPRSTWGARPSTQTPVEANEGLRVAFVHHSVTTNSYSQADVPGILRGIQAYHMDTNGWSDIGYNFAVDRFGTIWEARQGGIVRAIVGGHAAGFNTTSVGVVLLGDFTQVQPSQAMLAAAADIIGWRFAVAEVEPSGTVPFTTSTGSSKYPAGSTVELQRVSGHRDVGLTACPGGYVYDQLPAIRSMALARYRAYAGNVPTRWLTSPTHRYTDLNGESPDGADITSTGSNRLSVAARGRDDQLWLAQWDGSRWTSWEALGGRLRSAPTVVPQPNGGLLAFATGADGALWARTRTGASSWGAWTTLGGTLTSSIDAVRMGDGAVVVVGRGTDGAVWGRTRSGSGTWTAWYSLGGRMPAGTGPAVATVAAGRLDVLVQGTDAALWIRSMSTGLLGNVTWTDWSFVGGRLSGSPAATGGAAANTLDVVVRGADGRGWATRRSGGWSTWVPISRQRVAPHLGIVSWGTDRLDVTAMTPDGRVFETWWTPSGGW